MNEFYVGQRVEGLLDYDNNLKGKHGTIVKLNNSSISVEWDENVGGHQCGGSAKNGHGWNMSNKPHKTLGPYLKPLITSKEELLKSFINKKITSEQFELIKEGVE